MEELYKELESWNFRTSSFPTSSASNQLILNLAAKPQRSPALITTLSQSHPLLQLGVVSGLLHVTLTTVHLHRSRFWRLVTCPPSDMMLLQASIARHPITLPAARAIHNRHPSSSLSFPITHTPCLRRSLSTTSGGAPPAAVLDFKAGLG